jgi:lycopene cyclase domain-containing protein
MTYLTCLLAGSACLAALDCRFRLFFWRAPLAAVVVLVVGVAVFLAWDAAGIAAGIFEHGASPLATGVMLAPELPLEEPVFLAFFCYTAGMLFAGAERIARRRPARTGVASASPGRSGE